MNELMSLQMAFGDKRLAAALERAHERSVSGVRAHVGLQTTRVSKLLDAVAK